VTTVDEEQVGQWLPLRDAASTLHVAEKTARRRVKAGTLRGRQVPTVHGQAWEVWVPSGPGVTGEGNPVGTQSAELFRALDLVDKLQQQNLELAGRLGFLQAELQQRDAVILALQAPREEPEPEEPPDAMAAPDERPRTSWWRRVLLGE
jgi:hypothetical protein